MNRFYGNLHLFDESSNILGIIYFKKTLKDSRIEVQFAVIQILKIEGKN